MKNWIFVLAALGISGTASAQSSVTLSGILDAGIVHRNGITALAGSQSYYNHIQFSGLEDLGGGNNAFFKLQHRFKIEDGTNNPGAIRARRTSSGATPWLAWAGPGATCVSGG